MRSEAAREMYIVKNMAEISKTTLERLILYYHFMSDHLDRDKSATVTSNKIADMMEIDDTQVRKDLAAIGIKGLPRVGFYTEDVRNRIREFLGFEDLYRAVVIGAGHLGGAISSYDQFAEFGLHITALFDNNPEKVGLTIGSHVVQPMERLLDIVQQRNVQIAVLTVPAEAAQPAAQTAVDAGIRAIWVFSSTRIKTPPNITVRYEHISRGLAELLYSLNANAS